MDLLISCLVYRKSCQIIHVYPIQVIHLHKKDVEIVEMMDRTLLSVEFFDKAAHLEIKYKLFNDAANTILEEMKILNKEEKYSASCRLAMSLILVHLTGDFVVADKAFKDALTVKLARGLQIPNIHKDRIKSSATLKDESLFLQDSRIRWIC